MSMRERPCWLCGEAVPAGEGMSTERGLVYCENCDYKAGRYPEPHEYAEDYGLGELTRRAIERADARKSEPKLTPRLRRITNGPSVQITGRKPR